MLFFTYGPAIDSSMLRMVASCYPQTAALYYQADERIAHYFAKPSCMGQTKDGCCNSGGNAPGTRSCDCPSCVLSGSWSKSCDVTGATFGVNALVSLKKPVNIGDWYVKRVQISDAPTYAYRLGKKQDSDSGCYLHHVFMCDQSDYEPRMADIHGNPC